MRTWHLSNFYFFYFTTLGVLIPYWPLFLQHRGFDPADIGQLMAILLLTKVVVPNMWAAVADKLVVRQGNSLNLLKFASLFAFLIYCLFFFVQSFWATAVVTLGVCVFWNASLPQIEATTLNHLDEKRNQYGRVRMWGSISFILTVTSLSWFMDRTGPSIILLFGAMAFFSVFAASLLLKGNKASGHGTKASQGSIIKLLNGKILFLFLLCIVMQLSHAPWQTFFSIYLDGYGYSKLTIGLLFSVGVIFEIIVFLIGYKLFSYFRLSHLLSFTFLIAGIRWCLVAKFPESLAILLLTQIMHSVTYGLYHAVMIQLVDKFFKGSYQIRGQALYSSLTFGVGGTIGSFLSGYIWVSNGPNQLFWMAGMLMFVAFVFSIIFVRNSL